MKQKKILIVEDELFLLSALKKRFTREGVYEIFEAREGQEALDIASKDTPDIMLLDIIMPKMDGLTMLKKLRETTWGKDIPVIILTNLSDAEKVSDATTQGVFDYLVKSDWQIEDVVKKVNKKLGI